MVAHLYGAIHLLSIRINLAKAPLLLKIPRVVALCPHLRPLRLIHFIQPVDQVLVFLFYVNTLHEWQLAVRRGGVLVREGFEKLGLELVADCGFDVLDCVVVLGFVLEVQELLGLVDWHDRLKVWCG